jgi:hypothetical protein
MSLFVVYFVQFDKMALRTAVNFHWKSDRAAGYQTISIASDGRNHCLHAIHFVHSRKTCTLRTSLFGFHLEPLFG